MNVRDHEKLIKQAKRVVAWDDRLVRGLESRARHRDPAGKSFTKIIGGKILGALEAGSNLAVAIPGMVADVRFTSTAVEMLAVKKAAEPEWAGSLVMEKLSELKGEILVFPDGRNVGTTDLAKEITESYQMSLMPVQSQISRMA
jgi:hypothetical protein